MIDKILVPLDGSQIAEQVLPYARLLGEVFNVPLEFLSADENGTQADRAREYLKTVADRFPAKIEVQVAVERGHAAELIIAGAKRTEGCLIAMVTHGGSGIKRWLLGSVASKVIQAAENPLLIVRAAREPENAPEAKIKTLIVPLDGSELAESILPLVSEFARAIDAHVVLARAYQVPTTAYYRAEDTAGAEAFIPSYDELVAAESREAREYLDAKVKEMRARGFAKVGSELLAGPAGEQIIDLGRRTANAVIAMSTRGRSGVSRWMLGSVAERVVRNAENPVLLVRAR